MADYRTVDWAQDRPSAADLERGWQGTTISLVAPIDTALDGLAKAVAATHGNGGAKAEQFKLNADQALRWFVTRNRLPEAGFFHRFFAHQGVIKSLDCSPVQECGEHDLGFRLAAPYPSAGFVA